MHSTRANTMPVIIMAKISLIFSERLPTTNIMGLKIKGIKTISKGRYLKLDIVLNKFVTVYTPVL